MDSVTQFVLGSAVGVAVLGRRIGVRKAAITGGLLGTLPDLDVFWPNDDPIDSFVTHRSATHSLIMHTLATPLIGEGLIRLYQNLKDQRLLAYVAVFLCLTTHALLDSLTIYGTQLFWPLWKEPVGLGSMFIIDPLYTIPLLLITLWALTTNTGSRRFYKGLVAAFVLSSGYLGWSATAQAWAMNMGQQELAKQGVTPAKMMATPVPFSTLFWRIIAVDETHAYSVYIPLLGGASALTTYKNQRIPGELACWLASERQKQGPLKTLADFSDGYFRLDLKDQIVSYSDMRMGLSQGYAFQFHIARMENGKVLPTSITRAQANRQFTGDMAWLKAGVLGQRLVRPVEQANLLGPATAVAQIPKVGPSKRC